MDFFMEGEMRDNTGKANSVRKVHHLAKDDRILHLVGKTLFAWDRRKAMGNGEKHGVSFVEAATVFADEGAVVLPDPDHSEDEDRFVLIGYSAMQRMLTVVHVERGRTVRIISAWAADREERKIYEEEG